MGTTAVPQVRCVVETDAVLLGKCVVCTSQINAVPLDTPFVAPTVVLLVSSVVGTTAVQLGTSVVVSLVIIAVHLVTCVVESWVIGAALLET